MSDCIFCMIKRGEIPCKKAYEDDQVLAFYDINPAAPVHIVVIPKIHIGSLAEVTEDQLALIGHLHGVMQKLAAEQGLSKGFRIVNNCGEEGGQTVPHLHFHLLGGRSFGWPPG